MSFPIFMNTLEQCTKQVIKNLVNNSIYSNAYFDYNPESKRLSFTKEQRGTCHQGRTLEELFLEEDIKTCEFHDLGRSVKKALSVASMGKMLYNRIVVEVAKKTPFPKFKNRLYRLINVNIPELSEVIVAPNVFIDYLYPELITINPGTFIGEEAILTTHYFTAQKFVIGNINLGKDCLIGGRSIILPGVTLGDGAEIGLNSVIARDIESGQKVRPCEFTSYR